MLSGRHADPLPIPTLPPVLSSLGGRPVREVAPRRLDPPASQARHCPDDRDCRLPVLRLGVDSGPVIWPKSICAFRQILKFLSSRRFNMMVSTSCRRNVMLRHGNAPSGVSRPFFATLLDSRVGRGERFCRVGSIDMRRMASQGSEAAEERSPGERPAAENFPSRCAAVAKTRCPFRRRRAIRRKRRRFGRNCGNTGRARGCCSSERCRKSSRRISSRRADNCERFPIRRPRSPRGADLEL